MRKFILLALLTISFTASTQESVLLRLNYNQGDNYITYIELEQNMGEQGGMSMMMKMNSKVNSVDDELIML